MHSSNVQCRKKISFESSTQKPGKKIRLFTPFIFSYISLYHVSYFFFYPVSPCLKCLLYAQFTSYLFSIFRSKPIKGAESSYQSRQKWNIIGNTNLSRYSVLLSSVYSSFKISANTCLWLEKIIYKFLRLFFSFIFANRL